MPRVKVVSDSACDLPPRLAEELDITVVPLTVRIGYEEFVDRRDLDPSQFWERFRASGEPPVTSAPSPGAFRDAFAAARDAAYDGVVCITISKELSSSHQSARTAAAAMRGVVEVHVVDSRSVSMGQGLVAAGAAALASRAESAEEVATETANLAARVKAFGAIGDVEALRKGGRIGSGRALLGSLLAVRPIIEIRDGRVEVESRQRTRARSLRYLADKVSESGPVERLVVVHGNSPDSEEFVSMLASVEPSEELIVADIGPVIGSHTGPGTVGVAFLPVL